MQHLRHIIATILLAAVQCLPIFAQQPQTITGKVVAIADGDTLTVLDANRQQHKIRLEGIDSPESGQDFGSRNSRTYHRPDCPDYSKVSERNRVPFKTEADAVAAGYRRARNCPGYFRE